MTDTYDAGYLPDDEICNQDSIRVELAYAHDFYSSTIESQQERIAELEKEQSRLVTFVNCHIEKWKGCREVEPSLQVLKRGMPKIKEQVK